MVTLRKAHVKCPKCGADLIVRDNGGLSKEEADQVWKAFEQGWAMIERAFARMGKLFK